jgi:hypothetical protein
MHIKFVIISILAVIFLIACSDENETSEVNGEGVNAGNIILVEEVVQANNYTYLRADQNGEEKWIAVTKQEIEEGSTLYYMSGLEMKNFESKDLGRTFESVLFVQNISDKPFNMPPANMMQAQSPHSNVKPEAAADINVEPASGGITIGELFTNRNEYSGKVVKIRGKVVKANPGIMDRNWFHIQDGTGDETNYDLTVTTSDMVDVNDIATFEGKVTLNRDFGSGYSYDIILEEAKLVSK